MLFVDAAHPGVVEGAALSAIVADARPAAASHALPPQAVLRVAQQLLGHAPPAWLLAIEGQAFDLGEALSTRAERHLDRAAGLALDWLRQRRAETGEAAPHA